MQTPTVTVAIFEDNATRAELYGHWLDHVDVRVAVTKRQALEVVDGDLTVAVLAEEFGGGAAEKVLELIRARSRYGQVITTSRNRQRVVPSLDVDNHLAKPIFEADLRDRVERLGRQSVFCETLEEYYRATANLTAARKSEDDGAAERVADLEERVSELKPVVIGIRAELDDDDLAAVANLVSRATERYTGAEEGSESKYIPRKCFNCGQEWSVGGGSETANGAVRLGSSVWRCTDCGHIQLGGAAGNPRLTHSQ